MESSFVLPQVNTCVPYPCRGEGCVGGIARVVTAVENIRRDWPESLLLNAGDNFQVNLGWGFNSTRP